MATLTTQHLHEFSSKIYKIVAVIGAHSLNCVRGSPAITGKIDKTAIKIRVVSFARQEMRFDLDKVPLDVSPPVLVDADRDPQASLEYFVYYETISQLLSFILKEMNRCIDNRSIPARSDMNRIVILTSADRLGRV